jgi:hypothetical protein
MRDSFQASLSGLAFFVSAKRDFTGKIQKIARESGE